MPSTNTASLIFEPSATQHWKTLFPNKSALLGSHNLNEGEELIAEIASVSVEEIRDTNGKLEEVAVVKFVNAPPMVMNITNARTISSLYGDLYTGWIGKSIQIYATPVKAFGQVTMALRVRGAIPDTNQDIGGYESALKGCETLDDLKKVFTAIPKHIKPKLIALKDEQKENLQ